MTDFNAAREHMVDSQIHPSGIIIPQILEAYETLPRERFVPEKLRGLAYCDTPIEIASDRCLIDPMTHARMVQALEPKPNEVALDVACGLGYTAAVLSGLVTTVVALENKQRYLDEANAIWQELGLCNIAGYKGKLTDGCKKNGPFDLIFLNGAVAEIPEVITSQLAPGGRMVTIVKKSEEPIGQVVLLRAGQEKGQYSSLPLFEASCSYLPGFEPTSSFSF